MKIPECLENMYWRIYRFFNDLCWQFKYRFVPRHKYNIVRTGLPPGYYDFDIRLIAATFEQTKSFLEISDTDWNDSDYWRNVYKCFNDAVIWWDANKESVLCISHDETLLSEMKTHMKNIVEHIECMWF